MKSPVSENAILQHHELEPGFSVFRCPDSGGIWIQPRHYWTWRDYHHDETIPVSSDDVGADLEDSPAGKLCPECGMFLIRHSVGHGLGFHLDRCGRCGGVWLDANEWEALKSHDLHDQLHMIFTSTWQAEVKRQQQQAGHDRQLHGHLGDADAQRVREIQAWVESHPKRAVILAALAGHYDA